MIPNLVHFVWLTGPNSRDFSFVNYLAVRAARETQLDAQVILWTNEEPVGNVHWERAKLYARVEKREAPTSHNDIALTSPQVQSDVLRLQILLEHGGVYCDTDTLLLDSLRSFFRHKCVMSPDTVGETKSFSAGLIMAEPNNAFLRFWLEQLKVGDEWADHSTRLPWLLYVHNKAAFSEFLTVVEAENFIPFDWRDPSILADEVKFKPKYAIHMWETIWSSELAPINDYWLRRSSSHFAQLFSRYAWRPKVAVYAIAKNEEQFVDRFCASAGDADLILIVDTGSSDGTVKAAHALGYDHVATPSIYISPWRFDIARNTALSMLPKDVDICVSLDLDEELQPGWRDAIEKAWTWGTTRLKYRFDWGSGIAFWYEKIHARHGYRWHHPCHEYPVPDRITERWATCDHPLLVIHKPDPSKPRSQYLDLLRVSVEEDPQDPRNAFYYARELSFHRRWEDAITECKRYLSLPRADWKTERCYAMRVISRCYQELGDWDEALAWAHRAVAEAPQTREPYVEVSTIAYRLGQWSVCYGAAISALAITEREWVYTVDPAVWGAQPHDLAALAAWNLGLHGKALEHGTEAARLAPDDTRIAENLRHYSAARG